MIVVHFLLENLCYCAIPRCSVKFKMHFGFSFVMYFSTYYLQKNGLNFAKIIPNMYFL